MSEKQIYKINIKNCNANEEQRILLFNKIFQMYSGLPIEIKNKSQKKFLKKAGRVHNKEKKRRKCAIN